MDLDEDVIVSPDTRRENRIPPHQSRTLKWPVLDASGAPSIDLAKWRFSIEGSVANPISWNWKEFQVLPQVRVCADFHCVTRWSRLDNLWEGVSVRELVDSGRRTPSQRQVCLGSWIRLRLDHELTCGVYPGRGRVGSHRHDGEPLSVEHGGPARLIVPQLYAWKSAKWVAAIEFRETDEAGFWEQNGYHMRGDPWNEERFGY